MKVIAFIHNYYDELFGIPRQSGIVNNKSDIIFEKEFSDPSYFIGLEEFNYIWIIWEFSENIDKGHHPTVRPPKLGGNVRKGVFATRSPFRPNPIGISSVKITDITFNNGRAVITVEGADLKDKTPIYDIKPYLPYADIHKDATNGYADTFIKSEYKVAVACIADNLSEDILNDIKELVSRNPAPAYKDNNGEYGLSYAGYNIRYRVLEKEIEVISIEKRGR